MQNKPKDKVWGLYCPKEFNPEKINEMSEHDVWKAINTIGGFLFWELHDRNKPWRTPVSPKEKQNLQYALEFLVYYTKKFGVEFSKEPTEEEHVERSASYNEWYTFWQKHFENMPKKEYSEYISGRISGADVTKYLPKKTWQETKKEDKKILVRKIVNILKTQITK